MTAAAASVVFDAPDWPVLLRVAAGAGLAWELATLIRGIRRARPAPAAAGLTFAAIALGPIAALIAWVHGGLTGVRHGGAVRACLWGGCLTALGAATALSTAGAVAAIGACGAAWCVRAYRRTTAPLPMRWRALLLAMRIAVVGLLIGWALGPGVESRFTREIGRTVLIGVDVSASMARTDMPGDYRRNYPAPGGEEVARIDAVRQAMRDNRATVDELADRAAIRLFLFDSRSLAFADLARPAAWEMLADVRADGPATALGDAAADAFDRAVAADAGDVAAVVLISDGCNNTSDALSPDRLAAVMDARGVPIHAVGVGSERITEATRSLSVTDLQAADRVEAFNRLPVTATVEAVALNGRDVLVTCRFGDTEVGVRRVAIDGDRVGKPVRFVHVPLNSGFHRLTVSARPVGGRDGLAGEPEAAKLVQVVDRGLRVLYVEGRLRYESKYVARALAAAGRFSLDRRILGGDRGGGLGDELEDWLTYHVVVFGNVAPGRFTTGQLEIVRRLVDEYGKGFCMIGGRSSFAGGGWADTPIADVLPVDMRLSSGQIDGPLRVVPTPDGEDSDVMRIGAADGPVREAWGKLDPLAGADRLAGIKPGAEVLATTADGEPLIVTQTYGKGRSMAIAFDTTWRWVLTPADTADLQRRFWRQAMLHLASPKPNVWITTDRTRYDLRRLLRGAETIEITAGVEDAGGRPMPDVEPRIVLTSPDGDETPISLQSQGTARRGRISPPARPGTWRLTLTASVGGEERTGEHRFEVVRRDLEALEPLANTELLRRVAAESGGDYRPLRRFRDVLGSLRAASRPRTVHETRRRDLSAALSWPVVLGVIALLCAEWALRKRRGLI